MDPAQTPEKAYLDIKELKARTGLSLATLHRLIRKGKLPHFQPAGPRGRLLFPPDAIERCAVAAASKPPPPSAPASEPRRHLSGRCPDWMQPTDTSQETSDNAS
jgi:predicted DNA-binding transcriptional regulator AlpA